MVGHMAAVALLEQHQHGHVGVAAHVVAEVVRGAGQVEFLQDHMAHGHGQRGVGARLGASQMSPNLTISPKSLDTATVLVPL